MVCYPILHELAMASRYAGNPDRRKAADSLIEKLNSLTDGECMEIVHDILALERFDPEVRHMVIFEVLSVDSFAGDKGDRVRLFLTDAGYQKFQDRQEQGDVRIEEHEKVAPGGYLHYDHSKDGVDFIGSTLKELEQNDYLTRQRIRFENGRLGDIEYTSVSDSTAAFAGEQTGTVYKGKYIEKNTDGIIKEYIKNQDLQERSNSDNFEIG